MSFRKLLTLFAISATAAFGLAACGDDDEDTASEESEATVAFVSPEDGAATGDPVTAEVTLENFEIDPANVGKTNADGLGHLHFSLDGGEFDNPKYSGANGELAAQLGTDGQYSPATEPTITYTGLPAGEHTLDRKSVV